MFNVYPQAVGKGICHGFGLTVKETKVRCSIQAKLFADIAVQTTLSSINLDVPFTEIVGTLVNKGVDANRLHKVDGVLNTTAGTQLSREPPTLDSKKLSKVQSHFKSEKKIAAPVFTDVAYLIAMFATNWDYQSVILNQTQNVTSNSNAEADETVSCRIQVAMGAAVYFKICYPHQTSQCILTDVPGLQCVPFVR